MDALFCVWGFIKMNILIVGNGFDLSHYLPTKYDHFMDVMRAIEAKDTGGLPKNLEEKKIDEWLNLLDKTFKKPERIVLPPHDMTFDELFSKTHDPNFIEKTKEFYLTENIEICAKDVLKLQYRLELNCWYQYFKNHVEKIKTWIDFEQKIEEVLVVVARCIVDLESMDHRDKIIGYINKRGKDNLKIKTKDLDILNFFSFTTKKEGVMIPFDLNLDFCHGKNVKNGFSATEFITFLHTELEKFIEIFNLYLEIIVRELSRSKMIEINAEWSYPDKIFSFNYTNTYQRLHDSVDVEYLHGSHGQYQNIVLGISDIEDEGLKKLKAFGFTKYHQKLFKDTDYLFLDNYKKIVRENLSQLEKHTRTDYQNYQIEQRNLERINKLGQLDLNFYIWGHSLDVSDQDYIIDLFSLNDGMDRNVRVTVYHFDKPAKFSLLNNLLAILDKDKVERWMKNQWLVFQANPEVKFGM